MLPAGHLAHDSRTLRGCLYIRATIGSATRLAEAGSATRLAEGFDSAKTLVLFVGELSASEHSEACAAIRVTWGSDHGLHRYCDQAIETLSRYVELGGKVSSAVPLRKVTYYTMIGEADSAQASTHTGLSCLCHAGSYSAGLKTSVSRA